ncbi:uncharacterized protein [Mycetomoellerius zeteki]|uniref:uncharacterized protein n=1 Tax=Mycetomoellerius zeteki TaxID=64791 RepID=UPI00084E9074|nr:PREDICTED: uncharacterized protein LOC108728289 [Trachymyrmex zeteki]
MIAPRRPTTKEARFRAPRTAAVLLRCAGIEDKSGPSYADVMRLARGKISLEEMNIANTRIRRAQAGGLIIEIPDGEEAGAKAEALVDRLKAVLDESEYKDKVSVVRPVRRAEIRLIDVDQSISAGEVARTVTTIGQVPIEDIRTGPYRLGRGGLNTIWVQYSLSCANKLLSVECIRLGWFSAGVVPLAKRRLQCFRCFAVGHQDQLSESDRPFRLVLSMWRERRTQDC